jgi:Zn-dependent alcohol dehydrogenase
VISRKKGEPVELVDVVVPGPRPGEAVVDVIACGVCHTDLTYREGGINDEYPFLLGHEAAGTVEAVGPGVTAVEPGDFVILNWRAVCGQCRACKRGRPAYCFDTFNAEQKMTLTDGSELTPALGIGAFADKTLVHSGQCTKVDPAADPAVAGLLGCGVMAGLGAAINTGAVDRNDTVAVIGCGGVGDAAIAGAALVGAKRIIAVDTDNTKLDWARKFGATHTVNARESDVVKTIQDLTEGGLLLPRRVAEVLVVRRLSARTRLPHLDRPLPAGPASVGEVRLRTDRAGRHRGGIPQNARGQGAAFGGGVVVARIDKIVTGYRDHRSLPRAGHISRLRGAHRMGRGDAMTPGIEGGPPTLS